MWIGIALLIGGGMFGLVWVQKHQPQVGETIPDQGRGHVSKTEVEAFSYDSNPPTSGPHLAHPPLFGIFTQELFEGYQIHLLEHGGILIQYKTDDQSLITQVQNLGRELSKTNPRVVVAPNAHLDHLISVTAWTHILNLDSLDEGQITAFFKRYVNTGPEKVDPKQHDDGTDPDVPIPNEVFE